MILAADFGGTTIKLGLVRDHQIIARRHLAADAACPFPDRLEAVADAWEELLKSGGRRLADCAGVALALPFLVGPRGRVLGDFGKYPGAGAVDFGEWSRVRLGLPVVLENDLRMALLGECAVGAAQGRTEVVMLAFGTGIGCAVLSGGRFLRGANNRAATLLGHSSVAWDGALGRCRNAGCAEDLASTATLPQAAWAHPGFGGSKLARAAKIDYETLFALAAENDSCSQSLLEQSLRVWSTVVQNAVLAYDPEMVVLGGGVLRGHEKILPKVKEHLHRHLPGPPLEIPVVASVLGDDAALLGGEILAGQISSSAK